MADDGSVASGEALPIPDRAEIEVDDKSGNCMFYRYTRNGSFCGDTWHQSLDDAIRQAEYEYGLVRGDFVLVVEGSKG